MKRITCALLTLALCLSLTAHAAGSADAAAFPDAADITHREAVTTLAQLGVISGKDDGAFHPADPVTRAEAAKLLSTLMTDSQTPPAGTEAETAFTDIQGHWAKGCIEHCAGLGIINGRGDGTFDPDSPVTAHELAKMTLTLLGYDGMTGEHWLTRADGYARHVGLDLELPEHFGTGMPLGNTFATRDDAAQMLYNALRAAPGLKIPATSNGEATWNIDEAAGTFTPVYKKNPTLLAPGFLNLGLPAIPAKPKEEPDVPASPEQTDPADFVDMTDGTYMEAVTAVVRLGIMTGKEDGTYFDPQGTVTRGEAAKIVTTMMCGGDDLPAGATVKDPPSFSDIQGHWAEHYIEYCADMGIAVGNGDGFFDPNGLLTMSELLRMALTALGYDANAYRLNGEDWQTQVDKLAQLTGGCKLTRGLPEETERNAPVTRELVAQVLYNALQAKPIFVPPDTAAPGEVVWEHTLGDDTLLYQRFGLTEFPTQPTKQ